MPLYDQNVLNGCDESGTMTLKLHDRRILFFCPSRFGDQKTGILYFNVEFETENGEVLSLPGQLLINSDKVYRKTENGSWSFVNILKKINLKTRTDNTAAAVSV